MTPVNVQFLRSLRESEARSILPLLPSGGRLLEIGAGAGWQAAIFSAGGHEVSAVDLPGNAFGQWKAFPVAEYDGARLPFADGSFDAVYSSSVLEHVEDLSALDREIRRVLRPGGTAIHVMPRGRWCAWTFFTHFLKGLRHPRTFIRQPSPIRHGAEGHWYSEPFLFNKRRWIRRFHRLGWDVAGLGSNRLVYSGNSLFGGHLSLRARKMLAVVFGGVCQVYILRLRPTGMTR